MLEENVEEEVVICPSIVFKIKNGYYAINSKNVASIMKVPEYQTIPNAPAHIMGMFIYRGNTVTMADMRTVFKLPSLKQEFEDFKAMLETRKNDHIKWAEALEHSLKTGEPFALATDPHQCAFGKWYDNYKPENNIISFHMKKISEPHEKLHKSAIKAHELQLIGDEQGVKQILQEVKDVLVPTVLKLLDDAIKLFSTEVYHEMVLIFGSDSDKQTGIVVDEVFSVESLEQISNRSQISYFQRTGYVTGVSKSQRVEDIVLELDEEKILAACGAEKIY